MAKQNAPHTVQVYTKEDAYQSLQMINSWIGSIDTKISFALAFVSVLIGFIFSNGTPRIFGKMAKGAASAHVPGVQLISFLMTAALCLSCLGAAFMLIYALSARVQNTSGISSVYFFGDISKNSFEEAKDQMDQLTERELLKDLQAQIWMNSKICSQKVLWFHRGLYCFLAAIILYFLCAGFEFL